MDELARGRGNRPRRSPPALEGADVAKARRIIWPDGYPLSLTESVERLHDTRPDLALELIESKLISWLEMGFAPQSYSRETGKQLEEFDRLTEKWIAEHERSKAELEKSTRELGTASAHLATEISRIVVPR